MTDAPKPEEAAKLNGAPSNDGEAAKESDKQISSPPKEEKAAKVVFNGREYDSLADAEKAHKELQTSYQKEKAERERLEASARSEDDDFMKILFGEEAPAQPQAPAQQPPTVQPVDRDSIRVSLLVAERDPRKPYFKDVANEVAKLLATDPVIKAIAGIGQPDKAVSLAYTQAVAGRIDSLKAAEYTRGREEALREAAKPVDLAPADTKVIPAPPKKELKDMSLEEIAAIVGYAEPR
jgi:hypothetical protein